MKRRWILALQRKKLTSSALDISPAKKKANKFCLLNAVLVATSKAHKYPSDPSKLSSLHLLVIPQGGDYQYITVV